MAAKPPPAIKTLRLKVRREAYPWLEQAGREVNAVWNWANETSEKAIRRFAGPPKWLTGFDLNYLSTGATECFAHIGADTIQRVNGTFAQKRRAAKRARLSWRRSGGSRRSLGWVPFRAANLKRKGVALRFAGKTFRVFERERLDGMKWRDGCFAQDAVGDWWLCLPVGVEQADSVAPLPVVGIDFGLKDTATTSDGERLEAERDELDRERARQAARVFDERVRAEKAEARVRELEADAGRIDWMDKALAERGRIEFIIRNPALPPNVRQVIDSAREGGATPNQEGGRK